MCLVGRFFLFSENFNAFAIAVLVSSSKKNFSMLTVSELVIAVASILDSLNFLW